MKESKEQTQEKESPLVKACGRTFHRGYWKSVCNRMGV